MMKKIFLLGFLSLILLLCACKKETTVVAPETTYTLNPRVQSIAPGENAPSNMPERSSKRSGVTRREVLSTTKISDSDSVTLHYTYGDTVIDQTLSAEESETIISLLTARRQKNEAPTDAFNEDICFEVGDCKFAIATDQSGYILNCETGKYIVLSEESRKAIDEICAAYGAVFPVE